MNTSNATVDWTGGKLRIRHVKGIRRTEMVYSVTCPECGRERWLKKVDALKAERQRCQCYRCAQTEKGRLGWQATCHRWGVKVAVKHLRLYRLSHPSCLERRVMRLLNEQQISYEREVWLECPNRVCLIDFVVNGSCAIEVNGEYVHRQRTTEDAARYALIRQRYRLLVLAECDFNEGRVPTLLEQFLREG
jgi:hypothetical protein